MACSMPFLQDSQLQCCMKSAAYPSLESRNYIRNRTLKRFVRENKLPKPDLKRLAKLISDPVAMSDVDEYGESDWIDFIDGLALRLHFIDYDTEGDYAGYTSRSLSFPDNYIEFDTEMYNAFVNKSLQEQEQMIFDSLVDSYSYEHGADYLR